MIPKAMPCGASPPNSLVDFTKAAQKRRMVLSPQKPYNMVSPRMEGD